MTEDEFLADKFLVRVFGDYEAYTRSLPSRLWELSDGGLWASWPR